MVRLISKLLCITMSTSCIWWSHSFKLPSTWSTVSTSKHLSYMSKMGYGLHVNSITVTTKVISYRVNTLLLITDRGSAFQASIYDSNYRPTSCTASACFRRRTFSFGRWAARVPRRVESIRATANVVKTLWALSPDKNLWHTPSQRFGLRQVIVKGFVRYPISNQIIHDTHGRIFLLSHI